MSTADRAKKTAAATRRADKRSRGLMRYRGLAYIAAMLAAVLALIGATAAYADSMNNAQDPYSDTVNTRVGSYTVAGVHQSTSDTSITTFGSAMPLSTIYIDMAYLKPEQGIFTRLADPSNPSQAAFADGIAIQTFTDANGVTKSVASYNPVDPDPDDDFVPMQLYADKDNYLPGNLFSYTFPNAALLADGSRANVLITYSNAHILVDQRLGDGEYGANEPLDNYVTLAYGNDVMYSNNSSTAYTNFSAITGSSEYPATDFPTGTSHRNAITGLSMDARVQVVDDNGNPIEGTFIFPTVGINIDRDPLVGSGNNTAKPLWYLDDKYPEYDFFSEAMRINSGNASDIYVRPNTAMKETSADNSAWYNPRIYEVQSGAYQGAVKITADAIATPATMPQANNGAYSSGFITTANAAAGISVTLTGHGSKKYGMDTFIINGKTIWHRIRSITGPGGNIQTTTEANYGGTLDDGGQILGPGTYVVPDGKTVVYTMTPDEGYVLKELRINDEITGMPTIVTGVADMAPGSTMTWPIGVNKNATIKKNEDGSYTCEFPYNNYDHTIMVTWIPETAKDVTVEATKFWYDKDNSFSTRADITVHVNGQADYKSGEAHIYPEDFLPAQEMQFGNVADDHEDWTVRWGDGISRSHAYTGVNGETVYDKVESLPTQDSSGRTLFWFYDFATRKFRANIYNQTTGEFEPQNSYEWVNFMPKYDENGNVITYTVEEEVPDGYYLFQSTNNSGTPSQTMADYDYTLNNILEPVATVNIKVRKALDGRAFNAGEDYVFVLAGEDGAPMPVEAAVKLPAQGEDQPEKVVATTGTVINGVRHEADFGMISYRRSDLDAREVTFGPGTPAAARDIEKPRVRFWTLTYMGEVQKTDDKGRPLYIDPATGEETTKSGDASGAFTPVMDPVPRKITRTFDMQNDDERTLFMDTLPAQGVDTSSATGTLYSKSFTYTVTENPKHGPKVENDENTRTIEVDVVYDEFQNRFYIGDEKVNATAENPAGLNDAIVLAKHVYFENTFESETTWDPELIKYLNGRPIEDGQYEDAFTLKAVDTPEGYGVEQTLRADKTPMPNGAYGGTATSTSDEIEKTGAGQGGTNDVRARVGFDTITYTNDDLKKEIFYGDPGTDKVIEWDNGNTMYGPIPDDAVTSAAITIDGTEYHAGTRYADAIESVRQAAKGDTNDSLWVYGGKKRVDNPSLIPSSAHGYYYMEERVFTYKLWESKAAAPGSGYENDPFDAEEVAYEIKVKVTRDNATGKLTAEPDWSADDLIFENKYKAEGTPKLIAHKLIAGRDLVGGEFSFTVSSDDPNAPLPSPVTVTNLADGTIDFGQIKFTQEHLKAAPGQNPGAYDAVRTVDGFYEKTFIYKIVETPKNDEGVTSDPKTITCAVTVREDNAGNITVVAVNGVPQVGGDIDAGTFTNEYQASGDVTIPGLKVLEGGKLEEGQFVFQLKDSNGNVIGTATNDGSGNFDFKLAYNLDSVREDVAAGTASSAENGGQTPDPSGPEPDNPGTNNANNANRGPMRAVNPGDPDNPDNGPWTYTYKMIELPVDGRGTDDIEYDATGTGEGYTVEIKVTDDGKGNLVAEIVSPVPGPTTFTNKVKTQTINVRKVWIDFDADGISTVERPASIKIEILANGDPMDPKKEVTLTGSTETVGTSAAVWTADVEDLPVYDENGEKIVYTVRENNVPANYKVSYVQGIYTVVNTYEITQITGTKVWIDGNLPHYDSGELDGKLNVSWTDANGGSGTVDDPHIDWDNATHTYTVIGLQKYSDDGALRTYKVTESALDGYTTTYSDGDHAADGGTITNKLEAKVDINGTKVWKDAEPAPSTHPTPELTITRTSAKPSSAEETLDVQPAWNDDKTEYTFAQLDQYDDEGYEYSYKVTEADVEGYLPPEYSEGDHAADEGTITNVAEPEAELELDALKVLTGSTRLEDWNFELSLFTGLNGSGSKVGSSQTVPAPGDLSDDGLTESAEVTFSGLEFRIVNDNGTVKAQMKAADGTWVDMSGTNPTFTTTLYVCETPISGAAGLTQPSDGGTPVTITATNNNDGTMTVVANPQPAEVDNDHTQEVDVDIAIKKTLEGRDIKADDPFTFTAVYQPDTELAADEQARLAAGLDATSKDLTIANMTRGTSTATADHPYGTGNSATGNITFTFDKTGVYKFLVTESGEAAGVTNDAKAATGELVTVTVTKADDGTLQASVAYADGSEADFTNTYEAEGDTRLRVRKIVNGAEWQEGMAFWFKLEPKTAPAGYTTATMPKPENSLEAAHYELNHTAVWDVAGFTLEDCGKEFVYSVVEQEPSFTGYDPDEWQNDLSEHTITIIPVDNGDGTLSFKHKHDGNDAATDASLMITNRKKGTSLTLFASKEVVDENGDPYWPSNLGSFDLILTATDGGPMPTDATGSTKTVSVSDPEEANFGLIDFDAEYNSLSAGEEKTFTYTFTEAVDPDKTYIEWGYEDTSSFTITVKIAKDADGNNIDPVVTRENTTTGEAVADYPIIKNQYKPEGTIDLELTKVLEGRTLEANEFSFTLYDANKQVVLDEDGNPVQAKLNAADGKVELGTLKFEASDVANSPLTYNIREDIPEGAKAADDESIVYAADTTLEVRDAHVWVKDGVTYDPTISHPVTITLADNGDGTIKVTASTANVEAATEEDQQPQLTVTNYYEAEGTHEFQVYKYLEERPIKRAGFEFKLEATGDNASKTPMPGGALGGSAITRVLPDPSGVYHHNGSASFGDIVYTMDDLLVDRSDPSKGYVPSRTFTYKISEVPASTQGSDGLTYADTVYTVNVTITDNGDGTLNVAAVDGETTGTPSAHTDGDTATYDFTNVYDSDGETNIDLVKTLHGRNWQDEDEFTMVVEPLAGASKIGGGDREATVADDMVPLPGNTIDPDDRKDPGNVGETAEVVVAGTDDALGAQSRIKDSEPIKFTDDMLDYDTADGILKGSFIYKVTEDTAGLDAKGFEQTDGSKTTYYVRIDVVDDRMGNITATVSYYDDEAKAKAGTGAIGTAPVFENDYDAEGEAKIPVVKFVDLGSSEDDGGWELLEDSDKFTVSAAPVGAGPGVDPTTLEFTKATDLDPSAEGNDHTGIFTVGPIQLSDLVYTTSAKNTDADGQEIKYSDGSDVAKGVSYTRFIGQIQENDHSVTGVDKDDTVVYVQLTVIDKLDGTIDSQYKFYSDATCTTEISFDRVPAGTIAFVNVYRDVMDVQVQKTWHDAGDDAAIEARPAIKIQLTRQIAGGNVETLMTLDGNAKLYAADGTTEIAYEDGEATVAADQLPVTFKNLPANDGSGHDYTYSVVETDPGEGYYESADPERKQEAVPDDPDTGDDESKPCIIGLTNTKTETVHVEKVWQDGDDASNRGTVIVAALVRNGSLVSSNIHLLEAAEDWKTDFTGLPMYDNNNELINYTAREMAVPEEYYTSLIEYSLTGADGSWTTTLPEDWNTADEKYVRITNILLTTLDVTKVWEGIPTDNVTFELYRTTGTPDDIEDGVWDPTEPNADGSTWEKVMEDDGTTPTTHTFPTDVFYDDEGNLLDPEESEYTFTDLEKYDKDGNEYSYRVWELTAGPYFDSFQNDDVTVTNTNEYDGIGLAYPNVVKELEGRRWNGEEKFFFKIEPIKGIADDGSAIDFDDTPEDQDAKAKVPLPNDGDDTTDNDDIAKADLKKPVGAIGRSVDFAPITFVSGDGDDAHVTEGGSADYYYKIYEVDEDGNAIGGQTIDGITYTDEVHTLRIHLEDDGLSTISVQRFWDGSDQSSAVPVFTNEYKAYGQSFGYVIKRIAGREFVDGDEFNFDFTNLSGSPVRRTDPDDPGTTEPTEGTVGPIGYPEDEGVYVSGSAGQYTATGSDHGQDKAEFVGVNYINSGDLVAGADGILRGTFVYQFRELGGRADDTVEKSDDLIYDDNLIYLKVDVVDNEDGTLSVSHSYYLDAACTQRLDGREGYEPKLLVDLETGEIAPAGAEPGEVVDPDSGEVTADYAFVPSGYFRNRLSIDIEVVKKWVDEDGNVTDPIDNVSVNLLRLAVFVNPADGKYYKDAAFTQPFTKAELDDIENWELAEHAHIFEIGEFYEGEGDERTLKDSVSYTFENVDLYEHNAADGHPTGKVYIYRVNETSGSNAYSTTYRVGDSETVIDDWTSTDVTGAEPESVTVVNKVEAENVALIAAVKQLLGREWIGKDATGADADRYDFVLVPLGKGTYDANGELVISGGKPVYDSETGTNIPMPTAPVSAELSPTADADKARAADWTEYASGDPRAKEIVDKNGELERLARFGQIEYGITDLVYDEHDGHMQGDFFYEMKEVIPAGATNPAGVKYVDRTAADNGPWTYKGVTYDEDVHTVHVKVRENGTDELVVQVAYDEKDPGKVETGSQFTPVFTNKYDATADYGISVDKFIMGRKWAEGDLFDFSMQPLAGAPFKDANPDDFGTDNNESELNDGLAIHAHSGTMHVKRLIIGDDDVETSERLSLDMPELEYQLSQLNNVTTTSGQLTYSNGRPVPANTKYGEFIYVIQEEKLFPSSYPDDVELDDGTEYVKITAIDMGDGTLDFKLGIYADRYCRTQRIDPSTGEAATHAVFVNQADREIEIAKIWRGERTEDAIVTLQSRPANGQDESWTDVETIVFGADRTWTGHGTDTIAGLVLDVTSASEKLTVPAYAADGDENDLNDVQLEYRIVEVGMDGSVEVYYGVDASVAYDERESAEGYSDEADVADDETLSSPLDPNPTVFVDDLDGELYVTNVHAPTGEVNRPLSVVKDLQGRDWTADDEFTFTVRPIGMGTYDEDGELYVDANGRVDRSKLKTDTAGEVITDIPLPSADAVAVDDVDPEYKLTDAQRQANFGPITYEVNDLTLVAIPTGETDPDTGDPIYKYVYEGDFVYEMYEVIPDDATNPAGVKYGERTAADNGPWVKDGVQYSAAIHEVHVHVERQNSTLVSTVSYDGKPIGGAVPVFVNTYKSTDLTIRKIWVDTDADGTVLAARPDKIVVTVTATATAQTDSLIQPGEGIGQGWTFVEGSEFEYTKNFELNKTDHATDDDNIWLRQLIGLPTYDTAGELIEYKVTESKLPNYREPSYVTTGNLTSIVNVYDRREFTGTKVWEDAGIVHDNVSELADKFTVQRSTDGQNWTTVEGAHIHWDEATSTNPHTQSFKITGLPKYDAQTGAEYSYRVIETQVDGYDEPAYEGEVEVVSFEPVTVADAQAAIQDAVDAGTEVPVYYVDEEGSATYTTDKVMAMDPDTDPDVFDRVTSTEPGEVDALYDGGTVTNKIAQLTRDVKVEKKWIGTATEPVVVELYADGQATGLTATLTEPDSLEHTFEDLPKFALGGTVGSVTLGTDGHEVVYTVVEAAGAGSSYNAAITGDMENGFVIQNVFDETTIPVVKIWDDVDDQDGKRPDKVTIKLVREDGEAVVDLHGDAVADLELSGGNGWMDTFRDIPRTDDDGEPIEYRVEETDVPEGYEVSYNWYDTNEDGVADSFEVTNSYTPATHTITATKAWDDDDAPEGMRPDEVYLWLYGLDEDGLIVYDGGAKKADADNDWTVVWENLPERHYADYDLTWTVVEEAVFGYAASVESTGSVEEGNLAFEVTNSYVGPTTDIKVEKDWQDQNDRDGKRPDTVSYELWKKVGDADPVKVETVEAVKSPAAPATDATGQLADWGYQWIGLPVTEQVASGDTQNVDRPERIHEETVTYIQWTQVDEDEYNQLVDEGYEFLMKADGDADDGIPDSFFKGAEISEEDYENLTPEEQELCDGPNTFTQDYVDHDTLSGEGEPVYETEAVIYFVKEVYADTPLSATDPNTGKATYAEPIVSCTGAGEYSVINARVDYDTTKVEVLKSWNDEDDYNGVRPDHITVTLTGDDGTSFEATAYLTEDDEGNWTYVFEDLPLNKAKSADTDPVTPVVYKLAENEVPDGYAVAYASGSGEGAKTDGTVVFTDGVGKIQVVNTLVPDKGEITVNKVWEDEGHEEIRPESITIHLMRKVNGYGLEPATDHDGNEIPPVTLPVSDAMSHTWTDLPMVKDGMPIAYTVSEDAIEGYSRQVSDTIWNTEGDNPVATITLTNKYIAQDDPDAEVKVTYLDPLSNGDDMVKHITRFGNSSDAVNEANSKASAPATPSHEGWTFLNWESAYDEDGDWIIVAKYSKAPEPKLISYVDGQTGKIVSGKEGEITPPPDPSVSGMKFLGWVKTTDAYGNTIYVASYEPICDCKPGGGTVIPDRIPPRTPATTPQTSDPTSVLMPLAMALAGGGSVVAGFGMRRSEKRRKGSHAAK